METTPAYKDQYPITLSAIQTDSGWKISAHAEFSKGGGPTGEGETIEEAVANLKKAFYSTNVAKDSTE